MDLQGFLNWLEQVWKWLAGQSAVAPQSPFVHDIQLATSDQLIRVSKVGQAAWDWYQSNTRTHGEREAFAGLLLQLDANPALGGPAFHIGQGCRSLGFAERGRRFGVVYQIIPAKNAIRIISISSIS